jgi:hypothetical protein
MITTIRGFMIYRRRVGTQLSRVWRSSRKRLRRPVYKRQGDGRIPIGIFLVNPHVPTFEERYAQRLPNYLKVPPAKEPIEVDGKTVITMRGFKELFGKYIIEFKQ